MPARRDASWPEQHVSQPSGTPDKHLRTLYVCYFGLCEPLVQTQVVPYLRALAETGYGVYLLTFEARPLRPKAKRERREELLAQGIEWRCLPYHKRPSVPATLYDIVVGAAYIIGLVMRHGIQVVHARSHVPLVMALVAGRVRRTHMIFDLRGLMAEEYVDGGVWKEQSRLVSLVKSCERAGLRRADQVIVLSERLRQQLLAEQLVEAGRLEVIPCCTNLSLYPPATDWPSPPTTPPRLVYAGSTSGLYQLEEMVRFFAILRETKPEFSFHVLTNGARSRVTQAFDHAGVPQSSFCVTSVAASEVPAHLSQCHVGISFRRPTASQIAASPTKIGEYLAAGIPVVSNRGIGDVDRILAENRAGVLVDDYSHEGLAAARASLATLLQEPGLRARCQDVARRHFGLAEVGAVRYRRVYARVASHLGPTGSTNPRTPRHRPPRAGSR
jgi:glycosyltransferase involved in cell wall biosynthesis